MGLEQKLQMCNFGPTYQILSFKNDMEENDASQGKLGVFTDATI